MSFTTFKNKPVSSKVVLFEFASAVEQEFFINLEPGLWQYQWFVQADTTYNFENGAFCYGCFEQECTRPVTNGKATVNIISVVVDGETYSQVTTLVNLRSTNKSFWWDGDVVYIHFDNFDPPWTFQTILLGLSIAITNKAGVYNNLFFDSRLKSLSSLVAQVDPMYYGVIGYAGLTATINNEDGAFDGITVLDLFNQEVEIRYGEEGDNYANFNVMFNGIIDRFSIGSVDLVLNIRDKRKRFRYSIPKNSFDATTYPNIKDRNQDRPIPLLYGVCDNVPVICTNEEEASPASWSFKVADTTYHPIKAIDAVRVNGVAVTPASTTLSTATFTLALNDYEPGDTVTADVQGYESGGTVIENALEVIEDILTNYADIPYTSDNYDQTAWATARTAAPDIHYFTDILVTIEQLIERVCQSLNGIMFAKSDGKFSFQYFHIAKSIDETIGKFERFGQFRIWYPSEFFISSVALSYDEDFDENEFKNYVSAPNEATLEDTYGIIRRYEANLLLTTLSDVQTLATNLLNIYAKIPRWVNLLTHISHIELELLDDVTANLDRDESDWLGDVDLRVYGVRKNILDGTVELTLREI